MSPAPAFMHQKLYTVDVSKQFRKGRRAPRLGKRKRFELFQFTILIKPDEFGNLTSINLRGCETQFFLEGLFQDGKISVFTEDQWENEPVISGTHLTIGPVVSEKCPIPPHRDIRWRPATARSLPFVKCRGCVTHVACG